MSSLDQRQMYCRAIRYIHLIRIELQNYFMCLFWPAPFQMGKLKIRDEENLLRIYVCITLFVWCRSKKSFACVFFLTCFFWPAAPFHMIDTSLANSLLNPPWEILSQMCWSLIPTNVQDCKDLIPTIPYHVRIVRIACCRLYTALGKWMVRPGLSRSRTQNLHRFASKRMWVEKSGKKRPQKSPQKSPQKILKNVLKLKNVKRYASQEHKMCIGLPQNGCGREHWCLDFTHLSYNPRRCLQEK